MGDFPVVVEDSRDFSCLGKTLKSGATGEAGKDESPHRVAKYELGLAQGCSLAEPGSSSAQALLCLHSYCQMGTRPGKPVVLPGAYVFGSTASATIQK